MHIGSRYVTALLACTTLSLAATSCDARSLVVHRPAIPALSSKPSPGLASSVFGLASGPPWSTEYAVAAQMSAIAGMNQERGPHGESGPRIAPLIESSDRASVDDLLSTPTTDMALVSLPVLRRMAKERPAIKSRVAYVTPLYAEEVHVVARKGFDTLASLSGRRVALGSSTGAGADLFAAAKVQVNAVDQGPEEALAALKAGTLDATVVISGKPVSLLANLMTQVGDLHLVPVPFDKGLEGEFLPARIERSDYPSLVPEAGIQSVSVPLVLTAYVWPTRSERAQLLGTLVTSLLDNLSDPGSTSGVRKLADVNWAATLPDFKRLGAAQKWLDARKRSGIPTNQTKETK